MTDKRHQGKIVAFVVGAAAALTATVMWVYIPATDNLAPIALRSDNPSEVLEEVVVRSAPDGRDLITREHSAAVSDVADLQSADSDQFVVVDSLDGSYIGSFSGVNSAINALLDNDRYHRLMSESMHGGKASKFGLAIPQGSALLRFYRESAAEGLAIDVIRPQWPITATELRPLAPYASTTTDSIAIPVARPAQVTIEGEDLVSQIVDVYPGSVTDVILSTRELTDPVLLKLRSDDGTAVRGVSIDVEQSSSIGMSVQNRFFVPDGSVGVASLLPNWRLEVPNEFKITSVTFSPSSSDAVAYHDNQASFIVGDCESVQVSVTLDGAHFRFVGNGAKPLPRDCDVYVVRRRNGRAMRPSKWTKRVEDGMAALPVAALQVLSKFPGESEVFVDLKGFKATITAQPTGPGTVTEVHLSSEQRLPVKSTWPDGSEFQLPVFIFDTQEGRRLSTFNDTVAVSLGRPLEALFPYGMNVAGVDLARALNEGVVNLQYPESGTHVNFVGIPASVATVSIFPINNFAGTYPEECCFSARNDGGRARVRLPSTRYIFGSSAHVQQSIAFPASHDKNLSFELPPGLDELTVDWPEPSSAETELRVGRVINLGQWWPACRLFTLSSRVGARVPLPSLSGGVPVGPDGRYAVELDGSDSDARLLVVIEIPSSPGSPPTRVPYAVIEPGSDFDLSGRVLKVSVNGKAAPKGCTLRLPIRSTMPQFGELSGFIASELRIFVAPPFSKEIPFVNNVDGKVIANDPSGRGVLSVSVDALGAGEIDVTVGG